MAPVKSPLVLLVFSAVAICAPVAAQSNSVAGVPQAAAVPPTISCQESAGTPGKQASAPAPVVITAPFATNDRSPESARSLRMLSPEEMTQRDRDLEADAEASIQERAGFQNLGFNQGEWTYHQLVCPALPNHLLLRFSRNDGTREMSMFSAAIPRNGAGRIRIIPIVRKGYSLFSPAPVGLLTISAFNHIRAEENLETQPEHLNGKDRSSEQRTLGGDLGSLGHAPSHPNGNQAPLGTPPDWLGTGLCYAALAGANPHAGQLQWGPPEGGDMPLTFKPTLTVESDGGAVIRFIDVAAAAHPMEWNLTFDRNGKLLKATHAPAYVGRYGGQVVPAMDIRNVDPRERRSQPNP